MATALNNYVTNTDLTTILNGYVTSADLSTTLANYVENSDLANYVTNTDLSTTLNNYVTNTDLSTTLNDYVTETNLNTELADYTKTSDLDTTLGDKLIPLGGTTNQVLAKNSNTDYDVIWKDLPEEKQYSTMPVASVDNVGDIVQYTGVSNPDYINGYFYKCVLDGSTYKWENIAVQPASGTSGVDSVNGKTGTVILDAEDLGFQESTMPTADATNLGNVVQYVGPTTVDYIHGYFYECVTDGITYSWENINSTDISGKVDKNGTDRLMTAAEGTKLNGIEAGAQENVIESITLNGVAVSPDVNKNVALTVITNAVNDLVNYYKKSETYTKGEVDTLIGAVTGISFDVEPALPTTGIQTNVIYLIPKSTAATSNVYDEYINLDGTSAGWELIGDTAIDLSGYVTTSDLNTALADYVETSDLNTLLADYVTDTELSTTLADYVTNSSLSTTLSNYVTNDVLDDYVTKTELSTTLEDYVTNTELVDVIESYVTISDSQIDSLFD